MLRVYSISLGCPKNLVDSEHLLGSLGPVQAVDTLAGADLAFINTCGFILPAVQESIAAILDTAEDIKALPEHVRRAIAGWGYDARGNFFLKISPKTPSLDQLGKHFKLFTDKLELSGNVSLAERIKAARERVK